MVNISLKPLTYKLIIFIDWIRYHFIFVMKDSSMEIDYMDRVSNCGVMV